MELIQGGKRGIGHAWLCHAQPGIEGTVFGLCPGNGITCPQQRMRCVFEGIRGKALSGTAAMNGKVLEDMRNWWLTRSGRCPPVNGRSPGSPRTGLPQNISGRPYNSMNRLMLYMEMDRMGYTLPVFMTFRQLKDENLMIIKDRTPFPWLLRYHREA